MSAHLGAMSPIASLYAAAKDVLPDLEKDTILLTRSGSRAYGLDTFESDEDFTGVAFAPAHQYVGLAPSFEQRTIKSPDATIFELRKFLSAALTGNPTPLVSLFCRPQDVLVASVFGEMLRTCRSLFLSQQMTNTYLGYIKSQVGRYVNCPSMKAEFKHLRAKPAMHAVRAARMLARAHRDGELEVYRVRDREELLHIRNGEMSQEATLALIAHEETLAKNAANHSILPAAPCRNIVESCCMAAISQHIRMNPGL